jgi:hypothetical protein
MDGTADFLLPEKRDPGFRIRGWFVHGFLMNRVGAATASVVVWPERDTLPVENFAFMPPITKRCAMVSRNGKWGKGKV